MALELPVLRVEVVFVGVPPLRLVERASGVAAVEVDGCVLRCTVHGSFQPFLEALHGHEVISLKSLDLGGWDVEGNDSVQLGARSSTTTMSWRG
jgi:hypothetical protein